MDTTSAAVADSQTAVDSQPTDPGNPEVNSEGTETPSTNTDQQPTDNDSEVANTPEEDAEKDTSKDESENKDDESETEDEEDDGKDKPFHKHPAWQRMMRKINRAEAEKEQLKEVLTTLIDAFNKNAPTKEDGTKEEVKVNLNTEPDFKAMFDTEMEELTTSLAAQKVTLTAQQEQQVTEIAYKYGTRSKDNPENVLPLAASQAYQIYTELVAQQQTQQGTKQEVPKEEAGTKSVPDTKPSSGATSGSVGEVQLPKIPKGASFAEIAAMVRPYIK